MLQLLNNRFGISAQHTFPKRRRIAGEGIETDWFVQIRSIRQGGVGRPDLSHGAREDASRAFANLVQGVAFRCWDRRGGRIFSANLRQFGYSPGAAFH